MSTNNLYYVEINDMLDEISFKKLLSFVCDEKQEKIKRFHFDIDKKLSLYSELLVRTIICQTLNIPNTEIIFDRNKYGKPYLRGYHDFHFNLSHTRDAIAVAVSNGPVGVDIEKFRDANIEIAKRFFTDGEASFITRNIIDTDKRFYEIWTKKEAYIKFIGKGLSIPLNSFDVLDNNISINIHTFEKDDYIISVCNEYLRTQYDIIELSENEIPNNIMSLK